MRRFALLCICLLTAGLLLAACGDDDDAAQRPGADQPPDDPGLQYVMDTLGEDMDVDRIRELMTRQLRDRTSQDELATAVLCFPPALTVAHTDTDLEVEEDRARVIAEYTVTGAGAAEEERVITRVWEFELVDANWRISGLPDCPYEPGATPEGGS